MATTNRGIGTDDHRHQHRGSPSPVKSLSAHSSTMIIIRLEGRRVGSISHLPKRIFLESRIIYEVNARYALWYVSQVVQSMRVELHTDGKISKTAMAINLPSSRYN